MQRLAVDVRRLHYKSTQGINRGWRRSRLGGGQGSHFYAWWAPKNAVPLKESDEFDEAPDGSLFLRDIRHHDDHSLLKSQSFDANYLPITVEDLRRDEYSPTPWERKRKCALPARGNPCVCSKVIPVPAKPPRFCMLPIRARLTSSVCHLLAQLGCFGARVFRPFLFFAKNVRSNYVPGSGASTSKRGCCLHSFSGKQKTLYLRCNTVSANIERLDVLAGGAL